MRETGWIVIVLLSVFSIFISLTESGFCGEPPGKLAPVRIGTVSFSLIGIITGIVVFLVVYFLTRWFQRWLDGVVLARGRVDSGVRNSIGTGVGYAGIAIAALVGISAAGINLSSLARSVGG